MTDHICAEQYHIAAAPMVDMKLPSNVILYNSVE